MKAISSQRRNNLFFMICGRADLGISVSKAKFDTEADFDVHLAVASPKISPNLQRTLILIEKNWQKNRHQKMKCWESRRMSFGKGLGWCFMQKS